MAKRRAGGFSLAEAAGISARDQGFGRERVGIQVRERLSGTGPGVVDEGLELRGRELPGRDIVNPGLENMKLDFLDLVEQREILVGAVRVNRELQIALSLNSHTTAEFQIDDFERIADKGGAVDCPFCVGFARNL